MTVIGAVFWVFVILPHPTSVSGPYPTRAACEARRHTVAPGATTGCHLMTQAGLGGVPMSTAVSAPRRPARIR